ncbi:MAG: redoxin domain-containing protein [Planctomycetes bacterium]|nr:redoxin domain-containing protein [Planctomycetota bacterium]
MCRRAAFLFLVAANAALVSACSPERSDGPFPPVKSLKVLGKLPGSWTVTSLDGKEVDMDQLRGKVVFINRWATWCPPCVGEMPGIQALHDSVKDSDIAFLIVTTEKAAKVKEFVKKKGWTLPVHIATEGVPPILNPEFIPVSYVVNRKGEVVFEFPGAMDWDTDQARKFLKSIP